MVFLIRMITVLHFKGCISKLDWYWTFYSGPFDGTKSTLERGGRGAGAGAGGGGRGGYVVTQFPCYNFLPGSQISCLYILVVQTQYLIILKDAYLSFVALLNNVITFL